MTSVVKPFASVAPFALVASLPRARETASVTEPSPIDAAEAAMDAAEAATHMATAEAAATVAAAAPAKAATEAPAPAPMATTAPASTARETIGGDEGKSGNRCRDHHHLAQHDILLWTRAARQLLV